MKTKHLGQTEQPRPPAGYHLTPVSIEAMRRAKALERRPGESRQDWFDRMIAAAGPGRWTDFLVARLCGR